MFPAESIPDNVFLKIFELVAYDAVDPTLPKSWTSSSSVALRGVALTCRRFFDLTATIRSGEMWCRYGDNLSVQGVPDAVDIAAVERMGSGDRTTYRKVVISLGPSQSWLQRGIYAALPHFLSLTELILFNTAFSIRQTYPLLAALPSLRVFGVVECDIVYKMSQHGSVKPFTSQFNRFHPPTDRLRPLQITHLTLDMQTFEEWSQHDPSIAFYHPVLLLFRAPTLKELELLGIESIAGLASIQTAFRVYKDSLSDEEKGAAFASLTRVTFHVHDMDSSAAQNASWLLKMFPRHPSYNGPFRSGLPADMEVYWRISEYTSMQWAKGSYTQYRDEQNNDDDDDDDDEDWDDMEEKYDDNLTSAVGEIDVLGYSGLPPRDPIVPQAGILASGGITSYEGPLECIGYFISPTPGFHRSNLGLGVKEEWAKAELTPEPLDIDDLSTPTSTGQSSDNVIDSGLRRLVITKGATYKAQRVQNISAVCLALTLLACGRMASYAHPGEKGFTRIVPDTRMVACNLRHIDLELDMFGLEVLHAIRAHFRKTIDTIVLRVDDYEAELSADLPRSLAYHDDMKYLAGDIVAEMPLLRSLSLVHIGAECHDSATMATIKEDVKDYVLAWSKLSCSLEKVQIDRVRFEKSWGERWVELEPQFYHVEKFYA